MNFINANFDSDQVSNSNEHDELADEPPLSTVNLKSMTPMNLSLKTFLISLFLISHIPLTISTSVGYQLDLPTVDSNPINRGNTFSNRVTQHLYRRSTTESPLSIILIPILVLTSGLLAGLTIGYMTLDSTQLAVLSKSGTPLQKRLAQKVAPLRKNGHMLLITLLIANMIANETLPIVSEKAFGGGLQAVIISTVLVIVFSEIIPQTVCSTHALRIGAAFAKPVQILVYFFYPIVWPISWLLSKLIGEHAGMVYRPAELKELVNLHARHSNHGGNLAADVVTIIGSAIDLQERVVGESMTSLNNCFMLNIDTQLNYETMSDILASGHSRIPVYENVIIPSGPSRKIVGALLTKQLILIDPEDSASLRDFPLNPLPHVASDMPLLNILNSFQEGRSHLAVVCPSVNTLTNVELCKPDLNKTVNQSENPKCPWWKTLLSRKCKPTQNNFTETRQLDASNLPLAVQPSKTLLTDQPMGIICLEDVLEALLNEPIYDETDLDEHGHMAVPPYVPPEAFAALRKPSSYSVPSLFYDSKILHHSSRNTLQIETEIISTNGCTNSTDISKILASPGSSQAQEFGSQELIDIGAPCNLQLIESPSIESCIGNSNDFTPLDTCGSPKIVLKNGVETGISKALISHENPILPHHLSSPMSTHLTTDCSEILLRSIHDFDNSNKISSKSKVHNAPINIGQLSLSNRIKNDLNQPQSSDIVETRIENIPIDETDASDLGTSVIK